MFSYTTLFILLFFFAMYLKRNNQLTEFFNGMTYNPVINENYKNNMHDTR